VVSLLWACDEQKVMAGSLWWNKAVCVMMTGWKRERETEREREREREREKARASVPIFSSRAYLQSPNFLPLGPTS
jgi:hypothetical protein